MALRAALRPEDKTLSDDEWTAIAHDVMNRTGLSRHGEEDEGVRWIAVRHARDHIHIVAMLARQDGRRPSLSNERYRVWDACRKLITQGNRPTWAMRSTSGAGAGNARNATAAKTVQTGVGPVPLPPRPGGDVRARARPEAGRPRVRRVSGG